MSLGCLYAKDNAPLIDNAISQVRSFCREDMNLNFHDYMYEGTVKQLSWQTKKYWSVQGYLENFNKLPENTIVVRGRNIPHPSMKGGGGYFFCNANSGEVIGYLLMK